MTARYATAPVFSRQGFRHPKTGESVASGDMYFWEEDKVGSVKAKVYGDGEGSVELANPVMLSMGGGLSAPVYLRGRVVAELREADGTSLWTETLEGGVLMEDWVNEGTPVAVGTTTLFASIADAENIGLEKRVRVRNGATDAWKMGKVDSRSANLRDGTQGYDITIDFDEAGTELTLGDSYELELVSPAGTERTNIAENAVGSKEIRDGAVGPNELAEGAALANLEVGTIPVDRLAEGAVIPADSAVGDIVLAWYIGSSTSTGVGYNEIVGGRLLRPVSLAADGGTGHARFLTTGSSTTLQGMWKCKGAIIVEDHPNLRRVTLWQRVS